MQKKNIKTKITWRNWLIKKLLSNETSKEDILNFIAKEEAVMPSQDNNIIEDNNKIAPINCAASRVLDL